MSLLPNTSSLVLGIIELLKENGNIVFFVLRLSPKKSRELSNQKQLIKEYKYGAKGVAQF